jgi:hypothetical protein
MDSTVHTKAGGLSGTVRVRATSNYTTCGALLLLLVAGEIVIVNNNAILDNWCHVTNTTTQDYHNFCKDIDTRIHVRSDNFMFISKDTISPNVHTIFTSEHETKMPFRY